MRKRVIVSVISDLVTDQRVYKECNTLYSMGYDVLLVGRYSKRNFGLNNRDYPTIRFKNLFQRGPGMYLCFNIQLLFFLLFKKAAILWSNDLDTLLPNYLISKLKRCQLVYDSHEYFTMSVVKLRSRKIWTVLERILFPKLKNVITVNKSIQEVYEKEYHVPITVLRNVPYLLKVSKTVNLEIAQKKILIIQGVGINENRGAEEAVEMMKYLPSSFILYFIGSGTIMPKLKEMVKRLQLNDCVVFIDTLPYNQMMEYTASSYLGLIFEKIDASDEHRFALPNRFFDYIAANVPVLSTAAVEIKSLIENYKVGTIANNCDPAYLAKKVLEIDSNPTLYKEWKQNTKLAAQELCWEQEESVLINFMNHLK